MSNRSLRQTHVARQIVQDLGSIPTVIILSQVRSRRQTRSTPLVAHVVLQDSFYKRHTPEELELAFQSLYDFDHPDSVDMPLFAAVRSAPGIKKSGSC